MIAEKTWYKIVDYENGQYKTLFHGVNKSRVLKFNEWLEADMKCILAEHPIFDYIKMCNINRCNK